VTLDLTIESSIWAIISVGFLSEHVLLNCHQVFYGIGVVLSKWFYDIFIGVTTGAARCVSFVGGAQIAQGVDYPGTR
jgi:hypothetical protein